MPNGKGTACAGRHEGIMVFATEHTELFADIGRNYVYKYTRPGKSGCIDTYGLL